MRQKAQQPTGPRVWGSAGLAAMTLLLASCGGDVDGVAGTATVPRPAPSPASVTPHPAPDPVLMPDLVGLPSATAGRRIGQLEKAAELGLWSSWERPVIVRCGARPDTVARQRPAPGTPLRPGQALHIHTAALDLERFRGPCEPAGGDLGPVHGPDAALARQFYRFAADPGLGAPFAAGDVWTGIESGPTATSLDADERGSLEAWRIGATYAEASGPFSALDVVAASGGYYELRRGIAPTCPGGPAQAPPELVGLRAISLTAPTDTVSACMEWWGVTLFLDGDGLIRGVSLRLGSP